MRRSLGYPLKLIANNAGVNGSVVQQKVLESADPNVGYNAATGKQAETNVCCWLWSALLSLAHELQRSACWLECAADQT